MGAATPEAPHSSDVSDALVSIGVPTFNRAELLLTALKALLDQDYLHLEILISDNASIDDTADACARACVADPRIRYFRQDQPLLPRDNFKFTLLQATGKYFMWAADDDWCDSSFVSTLVAVLESDDHIALCGSEIACHLADDTSLPYFEQGQQWREARPDTQQRLVAAARHAYPDLIYGLFRRSALVDEVGRLRIDWHYVYELPIFVQAASVGDIRVVRDVLLHRRLTPWAYEHTALRAGAAATVSPRARRSLAHRVGEATGTTQFVLRALLDLLRAVAGIEAQRATKLRVGGIFAQRCAASWLRVLGLMPSTGLPKLQQL